MTPGLRGQRRRRRLQLRRVQARSDGRLSPLAGSTVSVPDGAGLGDVLFNGHRHPAGWHEGQHLADRQLRRRRTTGDLPPRRLALYAAGGWPLRQRVPPDQPCQLFVSNAHAGAGNGTVSAFNDGSNGVLTSIGASPFADNQTAPCWLTISPDGQYLYATKPRTARSPASRSRTTAR